MSPRKTGEPSKSEAKPADTQLSFESRFAAAPPAPPPAPPARSAAPTPASVATPAPAPVREAAKELRILAVHELVRAARTTLEARFSDVRVEGEISGFKRSANGHLYFTLKDQEAQIDCVMYAREAMRLRFKPQDGHLVRCRGRLTIYEGRGRFQLSVQAIEMAGAGALALAFEELKKKLAAEGLFDPERKRPLPFLPRRLGVVTSPQGAVLRDIVRVAHRRFPVPILLAATPVQGEGAAQSIAAALRDICKMPDVDVVIVARGGGSIEDLWAFNDEALAREIAACPIPVISAVGHETDFTIADFVADLRAPTPSAAAELAVPVAADLLSELQVLGRRLGRALHGEVRGCRLRLERGRAALGDPRRLIDQRREILDDYAERAARSLRASIARRRQDVRQAEARLFRAHPQRRIASQRAALAALERRLLTCGTALTTARRAALATIDRRVLAAGNTLTAGRRRTLETLTGKLDALSPLKVLERGYSVTRGPDGQVLRSCQGLKPGESVTVILRDGDLLSRIEEIRSRRP